MPPHIVTACVARDSRRAGINDADANPRRMQRYLRLGMIVIGVLFAILAAGLVVRMSWAIRLWPFAMLETRLGFLFLGSIAAAIAASILWIALVDDDLRVAEAGALNLTVAFGGMTAFMVVLISRGHPELLASTMVLALMAVSSALIYWSARGRSWRDPHPTPALLRYSFAAFTIVLILAGVALVAGAPRVFPWPLAFESSVMYGFIFLGAATAFGHAFLKPRWTNAAAHLAGFLAYDLVLIVPFSLHFTTVRPAHRTSLTIYTIVLIYSGALAVYYLAFKRPSAARQAG
jgi:hypothetical protein